MDETSSSLMVPYSIQMEGSEEQLTEKQVVLLMHDIYIHTCICV